MKINIAGDFYISNDISISKSLVENVVPLFKDVDYNIVNLESPITVASKRNKIVKVGPHLNGHVKSIELLQDLNVDLVTLANNHILDYGLIGLNDTLNLLDENNVNRVGAGLNMAEASKLFSIEKKGLKIAILNFTENEWSTANYNNGGANPLDIISNVEQIKLAKLNHDFVICIIHGGHEHYHLPSPRMVKHYRFYADNGANAIVCHHTHCISGYEIYNSIPIFYSLGNFIFTNYSKHKSWYTGVILQLKIEDNKAISFELFPTTQNKKDFTLSLLQGNHKDEVLKEIGYYSSIISDDVLLAKNWIQFLTINRNLYLKGFSPINIFSNRYIRGVFNRLKFNEIFMRSSNLKDILNYIQCESHVDACKEILRLKIDK